ncbi:hypothetical protein PMAYCL1PPCAC_09674, partial [Pristionchus mayeri]
LIIPHCMQRARFSIQQNPRNPQGKEKDAQDDSDDEARLVVFHPDHAAAESTASAWRDDHSLRRWRRINGVGRWVVFSGHREGEEGEPR